MSAVQAEIRRWLLEQQEWLQEAADRILKNETFSGEDLTAIVALLKTSAGRAVTRHRAYDELGEGSSGIAETRLVSIGHIAGIENLGPRHPIDFGGERLVVIYGNNGSGKSGYTRILKRATGKPRSAALKSNVFQQPPAERRCEIKFSIDGHERSVEWHPDGKPVDAIRAVDIFDTDEANHYLSKENAASYTPPTVALFETLAAVCEKVRTTLQEEQDKLVSALPALPPAYTATDAGKRYLALDRNTSATYADALSSWTADDESKLNELTERLKATDPLSKAKQKRATKNQAEKIVAAMQHDTAIFGSEGLERVRALRSDAIKRRTIAQEAGQLETAILSGIGSETWVALWDAARAYSLTPYPAQTFPATSDGALCVLCHQELSADAKTRLHNFENFAIGKLEKAAEEAEHAYKNVIDALPAPKAAEHVRTSCEAAGITDENLVGTLTRFWYCAANARAALVAGEEESEASAPPDMRETIEQVQTYCDRLEKEALQCEEDSAGFDRNEVEHGKLGLEAAKWTSQQAQAISVERERLRQHKELDSWKALANSRNISIKASEVSEKVITEAFVARFNLELKTLGATRLKVHLVKTRAERGKALHRLQLLGAGGQTLDSILSEGERRIVSLAAFLADVADRPAASPFVFDDPISSLDQSWEERTVNRLIALSSTRQVIVFTHRLSLLGLLSERSRVLHIRNETWGAGEAGEVPLYGKAPDKALNDLKARRLAQARKAHVEFGHEVYHPLAKAICSDFRILLERFVETVLLADVIQRHRREVHTRGKVHNLLRLRRTDCDLIDEMMTKYSTFEHSQSNESPVELPDPDDLEADLTRVIDWHSEFKARPTPPP